MKYAFIDLEVLVPTAVTDIELQLEKIDPRTGFKLLNMYSDPETYRQLYEERHDIRNQIFEGVGKYSSKLDFKSVYCEEKVANDVLEFFSSIECENKFVVFYYNTVNEKNIKESFIQKILPNITPFPVKYYNEEYSKNKRKNNTMADTIKKIFNLKDLSDCTFVGKSEKTCQEFKNLGATNVLKYNINNIFNRDYQRTKR